MKKKFLLFAAAMIGCFFSSITAQKIASFENPGNDIFNQFKWDLPAGSFGISGNPDKSGINKTTQCLLNHRTKGGSSAWTNSGDFSNSPVNPVVVSGSNKYLHVMIYSDQAYEGYIRLQYTTENNIWLDPPKEIRFTFIAGQWHDLVLDLQAIGVSHIYGMYFMSQDWGNTYPRDSHFYYDEIEINDNPSPRGTNIIETACTVADFETNGITPEYKMSGSNGGSTLSTADNPDITGANYTGKALMIKQEKEGTWWSRVNVIFDHPVKINSNTRYMHVLVKSPSSAFSALSYEPKENWFSNVSIPRRNEWCDVVIDMMSSHYNLNNTVLSSIGFCANSNIYTPDMEWYIDEIAFSADPAARQGKASFLDNISCELTTGDDDWTFINTNPVNSIKVTNKGTSATSFTLDIDVRTDSKEKYQQKQESLTLTAGESIIINHELAGAVPGFYRYYINVSDGNIIRNKVIRQIGYNPEKMNCELDKPADFDEFWAAARAELASVDPEYKVTFKQNQGTHKIYDVEMKSIKGRTIKGYYSVPDKGGKFPGIVFSNGFGMTASIPGRNDDYAVFTYNIRGMGISTDYEATDDVFVNGLQDKNTYYYRECYMDALRAVDFLCSRPEVNTKLILAEGESQGGALTFVIAAMDSRIIAAAPMVPFLSDFPHYYQIKENVNEIDEWPMNLLNQYMRKYNLKKEDAFKNLSYFDIKNMADKIQCPLLMAVGLQDPTCPPHINFAAFNQVSQSKEYKIYKTDGHYVDRSFIAYKDAWFKKIIDRVISGEIETMKTDFDQQIQTFINGKNLNIYSSQETAVDVSIYLVDGSLSKKISLHGSESIVMDSGIYILCASDSQQSMTRKIIVP